MQRNLINNREDARDARGIATKKKLRENVWIGTALSLNFPAHPLYFV